MLLSDKKRLAKQFQEIDFFLYCEDQPKVVKYGRQGAHGRLNSGKAWETIHELIKRKDCALLLYWDNFEDIKPF